MRIAARVADLTIWQRAEQCGRCICSECLEALFEFDFIIVKYSDGQGSGQLGHALVRRPLHLGARVRADDRDLREALAVLPRSSMLVETDAPYLTPVPHRGAVNASYLVPLTVRTMAETRGEPLEQVCTDLWDNAMRAFGQW